MTGNRTDSDVLRCDLQSLSSVICRHGLYLVSDIYLACYRFGDEGLAVFFEEVDLSLLCGY